MLNSTETRLTIIENFSIDHRLPKYRKEKQKLGHIKNMQTSDDSYAVMYSEDFSVNDGMMVINSGQKKHPLTFWQRVMIWFKSRKPVVKTETLSILQFFSEIKIQTQKIELVESRARGYELALINAEKSGQVALKEKLKDGLQAYKAETLMLSIGIEKFVAEKTIVDFYKQCKKGLRLDYVKNFVRVIPDEIIALKEQADALKIFDNYAVLHYDPESKSYAETKAETAARKDPILFGLLKGRTDLYVLGDWIDEICDLTLDQMAEVLGYEVTKSIDTSSI